VAGGILLAKELGYIKGADWLFPAILLGWGATYIFWGDAEAVVVRGNRGQFMIRLAALIAWSRLLLWNVGPHPSGSFRV
jgi:hypothetical protein